MASRDAGSAGSTSDAVASGVDEWHRVVATRDASLLAGCLPTTLSSIPRLSSVPSRNKALTTMYLAGAMQVLAMTHSPTSARSSPATMPFWSSPPRWMASPSTGRHESASTTRAGSSSSK